MTNKNPRLFSLAMRTGVEFTSGILVGTLIGRGIDIYFETYPWGLVIFIVLGIMAGGLNIYRLLDKNWDKIGEK